MFSFLRKLFAKDNTPQSTEESSPMEKFLIVGLGNIGPDYEGTRHNIGFRIVDALAASAAGPLSDSPRGGEKARGGVKAREGKDAHGEKDAHGGKVVWEDKRYGFVTRISVKGRQLILLKPSTFMNLSGNAVRYWMQQEKIELSHLLICVDDIALPFGQMRMKPGGSDAGHNGLKHIAQILGTQQYARLRFGVGNDFFPGQQVDYVLSQFPPEQEELIPERTKVAAAAIKTFCLAGIQMAMNELSRKVKTQ